MAVPRPLFDSPVLVVHQQARLVEVSNRYAVRDLHGQPLGTVTEVGQSRARKLLRLLSSLDRYLTHRLELRDPAGRPLLLLTRPAALLHSRAVLTWPDGTEAGQIVQRNALGRITFGLHPPGGGPPVGAIRAQNWRAWDFAVVDHAGTEVARITRSWEGLARALFTAADSYVVRIHRPLDDPLRVLVVAAALTVDTALTQDR